MLATSLPAALQAQSRAAEWVATAATTCVAPAADGTLEGAGPDYRVRFAAGAVDFSANQGNAGLRFTLDAVRRGATTLFAGPTATLPHTDGTQVRYPHAPTLTEIYELRGEGVEQSFRFTERPVGRGDLVVRGRITTELPLTAASDAGVRFGSSDSGGITFGAVTGIDANGTTVRGSIRAAGDHVEWVLPAAFVDAAVYPLLLDPLIGNAFTIGNEPGDDIMPSVAYDETTDRYLVVWNLVQTSTVAEVRGRFVSGAGAPIGSSFVIDQVGDVTVRPQVVNVAASNRFLVVFRRYSVVVLPTPSLDRDWYMRAVTASDGTVSAPVVAIGASTSAQLQTEVAVAGDRRSVAGGSNQDALLAIRLPPSPLPTSLASVVTRAVDVPVTGNPTLGSSQQIQASPLPTLDLREVGITANGGSAGRWLVTYRRQTAPAQSDPPFFGIVVDETGAACSAEIWLAGSPAVAQRLTAATKDGLHFAIAWEDAATLGVALRTLTVSGPCGSLVPTLGPTLDPTSAGLDSKPVLDFARTKYVLAWRRSYLTGGTPRVFVRGLDPGSCVACGAEWSVDTTIAGLDTPAVASRWSGGATTSDEALVVWSNDTVRGRRFEAVGAPSVNDLGGGCGASGTAGHTGQPQLGDATFALTLTSPTAFVLGAVVGLSPANVACGPCTVVPNLDIVLAGGGPHPIPLACDVDLLGFQFWAQWVLLAPGGCPLFPDLSLSAALQFTIAE